MTRPPGRRGTLRRAAGALATAALLGGALVACSSDEAAPETADEPSGPSPTATPTPTPTPSPSPSQEPEEQPQQQLPPVADRVSLPALMREEVRSGPVRRTARLGGTSEWTSWAVTYTVNGARVSGEMLVPRGRGPFPAVVLNHGYIDPAIYTLGRGLSREQEWLASNGFVVLHTDYRGHAASDPVSEIGRETRLVYTRDAIGAVGALRRERGVDADRVAMLGRSMGGGVTQNALVAKPGLVDAAVVFGSVSSRFVDNLRQFTEPGRPEGAAAFYRRFGTPEESPRFYEGLSPRTYFDRIEAPVLIHHGTRDDTCPIRWSRETDRLMRDAGVDVTLATYDDGHAFGPAYEASMRRTVRWLRRQMG